MEAATDAGTRGFCGLEVDVHWRDGVGMVVAHDELPEGWEPAGSLTFPGLLDSLRQLPPLIWLDFKNLSRSNAADAGSYLGEITAAYALHNRIIVEGRRPLALWLLRRRARATVPAYWIRSRPRGVRSMLYDIRLAIVVGALGIPALSMPKEQLTPVFARRFQRLALFTWTCNTAEEISVATRLGAEIILSDNDPPVRSSTSW